MSALVGIVARDGAPADPDVARAMRAALVSPQTEHAPPAVAGWDVRDGLAIAAIARLDDPDALARALGVPPSERAATDDAALVRRAVRAWGDAAPLRLLGDWAYAAWHARERRLVLARDPIGTTALYHAVSDRHVAFATSPRALRALPWVDARLDERRLAAMLRWEEPADDATFHRGIRRLPGAHVLEVSPAGVRARRYWRPEDAPDVRLSSDAAYAEALRDALADAVRARLRGPARVGLLLSGGLDSGAIAALAAPLVGRDRGVPLAAYTWVPAFPVRAFAARRFADEGPLAAATAAHVGNVALHRIDAAAIDPPTAIARMVAVTGGAAIPPANAPWIDATLRAARDAGVGVLLDGMGGNATVSWAGAGPLRVRAELAAGGPAAAARALAVALLPRAALAAHRRARTAPPTAAPTPMSDAFAATVARRGWDAPLAPPPAADDDPRGARAAVLRAAHAGSAPLATAAAIAYGVELRSPMFDRRVVELALGIPDAAFTGHGRARRWLVREAMRGLLPDAVRLCRERGQQGADVIDRLRAHPSAVDAALAVAERSPVVREYLDVARMRAAWADVRALDDAGQRSAAVAVLLRGLHAARFLRAEIERGARPCTDTAAPP